LAVERVAAVHGAENIGVYGSVAQGQVRHDSDADLVMDDDRELVALTAQLNRARATPWLSTFTPDQVGGSLRNPGSTTLGLRLPAC
jgi:predicted nucleotidyltransferase